jgi:hypothetical protein
VDAVFTSEDYGDAFAAELTRCFRERSPGLPAVQHVSVDRERRSVPISGTILRRNIHAHREWLSPQVYASFVQRVCLLGGESSGKSTLAEALAREFQTAQVAEFGRELWEAKSGELALDDMRHIAEVQVRREEEASLRATASVLRYFPADDAVLQQSSFWQWRTGVGASGYTRLRFHDSLRAGLCLCAWNEKG